ncbi:hypothetical protein [Pseudoclavibacter sp. RFBB5]|uniref:hypothetical protein n=1 Tax=Pseudoclavibacter sp. RFBB5 TaxID=2080574 RepID=UPI000CE87F81|nr:hypothetical protein [Pseudoclavibacter sp. RFBB5]PPG29673.1 hypothetical protein C5B97_11935 [Pseudoclavibacter sp. RFBB5]
MSPLAVVVLVLAIAAVAQGVQLASLRRRIRHVDVTAGRALWNSVDAKLNANKALGIETPRTTFTEGIGR